MTSQYRVPKELFKDLDLQTGKVVQCTSAVIHQIINGSIITNEELEGTVPLKVDLMIRSDKHDVIVLFDENKCVKSANVKVDEGIVGYFALMNTLKDIFVGVLKSTVSVREFVRHTMMLPLGYYLTENGEISIVFHLVVDDFHMSEDYIGNLHSVLIKVDDVSTNLLLNRYPEHKVYLDTIVRLDG